MTEQRIKTRIKPLGGRFVMVFLQGAILVAFITAYRAKLSSFFAVLLTLIFFSLADQLLLWSVISVLAIKTLVARTP